MIASVFVYAGAILALGAAVAFVRPRMLRLRTRARAAALAAAGVIAALAGFGWPAPEVRVERAATRLDEFVPVYQFSEVHAIDLDAPPDRVYEAVLGVRANEILLFRTLTWIRRFGRPGPEGILNATEERPILEVATRTTFITLAEKPPREIVVGTLVIAPPGARPSRKPTPEDFTRLAAPGFAKAAMNFRIEPDAAGGSRAHDRDARRRDRRRHDAAVCRVLAGDLPRQHPHPPHDPPRS